jgi:transcriptional regulator with XRE-family HTH domain
MATIRELRQARGWTQFELALKVGVQPQAIYLWESGRRIPQVPQLRKLGELFGMCSDEIDLVMAWRGEEMGDRPTADRRLDERAPGRYQSGRAAVRSERPRPADQGDA